MLCAQQETSYNRYYGNLLVQLLKHHRLAFTVRLLMYELQEQWSTLQRQHTSEAESLGQGGGLTPTLRKLLILARLIAEPLVALLLDIKMFKSVEFHRLPPVGIVFFTTMWISVLRSIPQAHLVTLMSAIHRSTADDKKPKKRKRSGDEDQDEEDDEAARMKLRDGLMFFTKNQLPGAISQEPQQNRQQLMEQLSAMRHAITHP